MSPKVITCSDCGRSMEVEDRCVIVYHRCAGARRIHPGFRLKPPGEKPRGRFEIAADDVLDEVEL